jgi:hypothetical protein
MNYMQAVKKYLINKVLIIIWLVVIFGLECTAQISGKSIPELHKESSSKPMYLHTFHRLPIMLTMQAPTTQIPNVHRYEHLAFFCRLEVKMEQRLKIPFKFRLGDVPYVDRLEGKRRD